MRTEQHTYTPHVQGHKTDTEHAYALKGKCNKIDIPLLFTTQIMLVDRRTHAHTHTHTHTITMATC